jgi:hypothetical protein
MIYDEKGNRMVYKNVPIEIFKVVEWMDKKKMDCLDLYIYNNLRKNFDYVQFRKLDFSSDENVAYDVWRFNTEGNVYILTVVVYKKTSEINFHMTSEVCGMRHSNSAINFHRTSEYKGMTHSDEVNGIRHQKMKLPVNIPALISEGSRRKYFSISGLDIKNIKFRMVQKKYDRDKIGYPSVWYFKNIDPFFEDLYEDIYFNNPSFPFFKD